MTGNTSSSPLDSTAEDFVRQIHREGTPKTALRVAELLREYKTSDDPTLMFALHRAQSEVIETEIQAAAASGRLRCDSE